MEKQIIEINEKQITIMEQPASFTLDLERKFGTKEKLIEYCQEVLKYPAGVNPKLGELLNIPDKVIYKDLELSLIKDGEKDLKTALRLFLSFMGANGEKNLAYTGEAFVKAIKKEVNSFKYSTLIEIGETVFEQIADIGQLVNIRDTFRKM